MQILVVDDEPAVRNVLGEMIETLGHGVEKCGDVPSALQLLERSNFDMVFSDVSMPGMDGLRFLERAKDRPEAFVLVTGRADVTTAVQALRLGAVDFVTKPFNIDAIGASMKRGMNALSERRAHVPLKLQQESIATVLGGCTLAGPIPAVTERAIISLVAALDARESETNHHCNRVSLYAQELAQRLDLSPVECEAVRMGGLLHDVGKIGVPDGILLKRGPLDQEEWTTMKRHPLIGADIVCGLDLQKASKDVVLSHHERFDGLGYPFGLAGKQIPYSARIFSIVDALDAITSDRPYRKKRTFCEAIDEITKCAGSQHDPELVNVFCSIPKSAWTDIRNRL